MSSWEGRCWPMYPLDSAGESSLLEAFIEYEEIRYRLDEIDSNYLSKQSREVFKIICDNRTMERASLMKLVHDALGSSSLPVGEYLLETNASRLIDEFKEAVKRDRFQLLIDELSGKLKKHQIDVEQVQQRINDFCKEESAFNYISTKEANELQKQSHLDLWNNESKRLYWPFAFFEDVLNSLRGKELVVVAGETGTGKTAFMINAASHWSRFGKTVGYISLEVDVVDLKDRIHQKDFDVNLSAESDKLSEKDRKRLLASIDDTANQNLFFCDSGERSINKMIAGIKLMNQLHKFDVFFIDYLQLVSCPGKATKDMEIAEIMGSLKALAMEIRVPIIIGSQLNREVSKNDRGIPRLSNLRESGTIEHSADVVLFLYRPILYNRDASPWEYQVIVAKQRSGRTGTLYMEYNMARQTMKGLHESQLPVRSGV